ncbi:hypothetical protein AAFM48_24810 [Burkholderia pseudomallei]
MLNGGQGWIEDGDDPAAAVRALEAIPKSNKYSIASRSAFFDSESESVLNGIRLNGIEMGTGQLNERDWRAAQR